ncbi:RHOMBOID-like protein 5 [Argentina anserina]|uniref:RHOMBOID-like protein 5 n=1 Tax=Argentina anserina TaxID=57926 RepID=UPI0021762B00|nr:RHOMBOID-like protein 5 [Potentilla anserina]
MGKGLPSSDVEKGPPERGQEKRHHQRSRLPPPEVCPPPQKPWVSWFVPVIFLVNVIMFILTMYFNNCPSQEAHPKCVLPFLGKFSFQPLKENPLLGASTVTLTNLGALELSLVVENGEGWRLLSCMWLHAGLVHLLVNMISLLFIGIRLEQEFGFIRIGLLYLLAGIGGSLSSAIHQSHLKTPQISVGASGALFGLLGAMLSELFTNWTIYTRKCVALLILVAVISLNLAVGFIPKVDNSAHVGGFLTGFFFGFVILIRPQFGYVNRKYIPTSYKGQLKSRHKWYQYVLGITAAIILVLGFAYGFGKLYGVPPIKNLP